MILYQISFKIERDSKTTICMFTNTNPFTNTQIYFKCSLSTSSLMNNIVQRNAIEAVLREKEISLSERNEKEKRTPHV